MRSFFSVWLSGCPVGWLYVCDTLVKVFVLKHANFFISASILFKLGTDDPWVLACTLFETC